MGRIGSCDASVRRSTRSVRALASVGATGVRRLGGAGTGTGHEPDCCALGGEPASVDFDVLRSDARDACRYAAGGRSRLRKTAFFEVELSEKLLMLRLIGAPNLSSLGLGWHPSISSHVEISGVGLGFTTALDMPPFAIIGCFKALPSSARNGTAGVRGFDRFPTNLLHLHRALLSSVAPATRVALYLPPGIRPGALLLARCSKDPRAAAARAGRFLRNAAGTCCDLNNLRGPERKRWTASGR
jgi:hypothetical protein